MTTSSHGGQDGIELHRYDGSKLCMPCRVYNEQQKMVQLFEHFSNFENDRTKPRLMSFHYRINKDRARTRRPVEEKTTLKNTDGTPIQPRSDKDIREFYDPARYGGDDKEKNFIKNPVGSELGNEFRDYDLVNLQRQGRCRENSSSIVFPGGYQGPDINGGLYSKQKEMIEANRKMCNGCPKQGECQEWAMKLVDPKQMLGGLTAQDRLGVRGIISEGLKSLMPFKRKTTKVFDMAKHVNGTPVELRSLEPQYINEVKDS